MHQLEKARLPGSGTSTTGHIRPVRADWVRRALQRCAPFAVLDEASFEGLLSVCSPVRYARRGLLYEQGSLADSLYVLASGRVRVVRGVGDSRPLTVAYRVPGELLGETALPDGQSYRGTATATEAVDAARLPTRAVQALLAESPAFARQMLALMVDRRLEAERRVESLLSRSVESRVAEFLSDAAERNGVAEARGLLISVRYTHQEIADYVGSTRETVTLTLGELRRRELVCFDHRRIVVMNHAELSKLV